MMFEKLGYDPDPPRGCGQKVADSCYLEGPPVVGGTLFLWTELLGDGQDDLLELEIPPRQMLRCNPVATIVLKQFMGDGWPFEFPKKFREKYELMYESIQASTRERGLADHVGANFYSAHSFAVEARRHGASRRVPKKMAKEIAEIIQSYGALPVIFSHSRMPVFKDFSQREQAKDIVKACLDSVFWQEKSHVAVWDNPNWGQYAAQGQDNGWSHYLLPILSVIDGIDNHYQQNSAVDENGAWDKARDFFADVRFTEQAFGMTWLTQVTYTLDKDGRADPEMLEADNITVLDLEKVREKKEHATT